MLLVADKEAAVMYVMFFGYYPIIKAMVEKKLNKALSWTVKFIIFNISMILAFLIVTYVFKVPFEEMKSMVPRPLGFCWLSAMLCF